MHMYISYIGICIVQKVKVKLDIAGLTLPSLWWV